MKWLGKMFSTSPETSMKRAAGFACFATAIIYTFTSEPDAVILGSWIGAGTALLGVAALTKT